jgi:hypothetical protein
VDTRRSANLSTGTVTSDTLNYVQKPGTLNSSLGQSNPGSDLLWLSVAVGSVPLSKAQRSPL